MKIPGFTAEAVFRHRASGSHSSKRRGCLSYSEQVIPQFYGAYDREDCWLDCMQSPVGGGWQVCRARCAHLPPRRGIDLWR